MIMRALTAANAVGPSVANCDSMPPNPPVLDLDRSHSTSGLNLASSRAATRRPRRCMGASMNRRVSLQPVAAEMLVAIVALIE